MGQSPWNRPWLKKGLWSPLLNPSLKVLEDSLLRWDIFMTTRAAAILLEIDANDLNNVFASWHLIILKIGKIGNYLSSSKYAFVILKEV